MIQNTRFLPLVMLLAVIPLFSLNGQTTADPAATKETKALFANLKKLSGQQILFGHQDALAYGVTWKDWHKKRSDVHDVCGKYPAVFGWDMGHLGKAYNLDTVLFDQMRGWIKVAYKMGGVNTFSWHMDNYLTGGNAWDVGKNTVASILPGGEKHEDYKAKLDLFAGFVKELKAGFLIKKDIPVVFRPFHEHTGSWFWWGQPHCTPDEYKALWRFTVQYLRDEKGLHNLLYCYSTDVFRDREHYLECYPGDEWVDILGLDDYHDVSPKGSSKDLVKRLGIIVSLAEEKGKIAALTETGLESIPDRNWWTERLLDPIKSDPAASKISWILVWRNARKDHHYAPYLGHSSVPDFMKFFNDPLTGFQGEYPNLYRLPKD